MFSIKGSPLVRVFSITELLSLLYLKGESLWKFVNLLPFSI
jgi:hypothetical protein